jgi:hypothetical protein
MAAYKIKLEPVSTGTTTNNSTLNRGVTKSEGVPHEIIIDASSAQIQGVMNYLVLIKAAQTTTTVESAITALTP